MLKTIAKRIQQQKKREKKTLLTQILNRPFSMTFFLILRLSRNDKLLKGRRVTEWQSNVKQAKRFLLFFFWFIQFKRRKIAHFTLKVEDNKLAEFELIRPNRDGTGLLFYFKRIILHVLPSPHFYLFNRILFSSDCLKCLTKTK